MSSAISGYYEAEYLFWDIKRLNMYYRAKSDSLVLTWPLKKSIANSLKKIIERKTMKICNKIDRHTKLMSWVIKISGFSTRRLNQCRRCMDKTRYIYMVTFISVSYLKKKKKQLSVFLSRYFSIRWSNASVALACSQHEQCCSRMLLSL